MIELCPVGRAGTPDEVANVGALLMGPDVRSATSLWMVALRPPTGSANSPRSSRRRSSCMAAVIKLSGTTT